MHCKRSLLGLVAFVYLLLANSVLSAESATDICANSTWSNCGVAIKKELEKNPIDPKLVIHLAMVWGKVFDTQYDALRKQGRVQSSTPDSEKIFEAVKSKIDPIEVAKDKAIDELLKKYLPGAASVMKFASGPISTALQTFFNSSEIATDYDELRLMNDDLQQRIIALLQSSLDPDWQSKLLNAVHDAVPLLRMR